MIKKIFHRYLQKKMYRRNNVFLGRDVECQNCDLGKYATVHDRTKLINVAVGDYTYIASEGKYALTKFGKFCSIGPRSMILAGTHPSKTFVSTHPAFYSPDKQAQIAFAEKKYFDDLAETEIGNDVWIGANVVIIGGVKIGDGAIIGAGAVVTKDIEPYSISCGVPARLVKYRFTQEQIDFLMDFKWWDKDIKWLEKHYKILHDIEKFVSIAKDSV